jgi:tetratricopeptide (TPR) repeat protein
MATVYLATDIKHNRKVALKVLRPELAATMGPERFLQEVQVTANLQHPHILPLFDSGEADGFLYYVMPYLDGESLRDRLAREGELPVPEAAKILKEVVDALASAHAMGVVHRDIKPDNVLLSGRHAMVTDFGVAKAVSEATGRHQLTTAGVALGTPAYMAPEQAAADEHIDHRADIYAVGAMGYELLAGRPPFAGRSPQQVLSAHVTEVPQAVTEQRASVPPELGAVIMRCLEKKPADRWQKAEELLTHLEAFATSSGGMTPTLTQPVEAASGRSGAPLWMKVALPAALVVATLAIWLGPLRRDSEDGSGGPPTATASAEEPDRLVVVPLRNLSADPELDVWGQLAVDLITRAIDQAGPIHVISTTAVRDALGTLGTDAPVAEIARALGARYALAGTVARTGNQVRFAAEIQNAETGERLRDVEPQVGPADSVEAVIAGFAEASAVVAIAVFDPDAEFSVRTFSVPASVSVFRDYQRQVDLFCQSSYLESIEMGNRVLDADPDYLPAMIQNRVSYLNSGRVAEADSVSRLLAPMRDRMTTGERLMLEWLDGYLYGRPEQSLRAADEAFRLEPSTAVWTAQASYRAGRIQDALIRLEDTRQAESACGDFMIMWNVGSAVYHVAERYEDQLAWARRGLERLPDHQGLMDIEIAALTGLGRVAAVDSVLAVMASLPPQPRYSPGLRGVWAARELRAHGHAEAAARTIAGSLEWFASQPPEASRYNRARAFYYAGRFADADSLLASLVEEAPENLEYLGYRGVTLAAQGRRDEALAVSEQLLGMDRLNVRGRHMGWPARIAAALGDADEAVRLLDQAFRVGFPFSVGLHREPWWDPVRDGPAFQALIRPR